MLFSILYEVFGLFVYAAILFAILLYPYTINAVLGIVYRVRRCLDESDESDEYDSNGDYVAKDRKYYI